jgi:hypothetical protein
MANDEFVREGSAITLALCAELSMSDGRLDAVRELVTAAGATFDTDDTFGEISESGQTIATVAIQDDGTLLSVEATLWCWELPDREDYESKTEHRKAQARFRELFEQERQAAIGVFGEPDHDGTDTEDRDFRYTAWRRAGAMTIVCETDHDPQFGERILVLLDFERPSAPLPLPQPLVEWLAFED